MDHAQPSMAWGLWYRDSHVFSTELFIDRPKDKLLSLSLKDSNNPNQGLQYLTQCYKQLINQGGLQTQMY